MPFKKNIMLCAVGATPKAFANAIVWFLIENYKVFPITDIFFIASKENKQKGVDSTAKNIPEAIQLVDESLRIMNPSFTDITYHRRPVFLIPEENVIDASVICVKEVKKMIDSDTACIFEMTAGRKTMSATMMMSASILRNRFKLPIFITYYWLVRWTRENLNKKAYELGIDDIYSIVFDPQDLYDEIEKIK